MTRLDFREPPFPTERMAKTNDHTPVTVEPPTMLLGVLTALSIVAPGAGFLGGVVRVLAATGSSAFGLTVPLEAIGLLLAGCITGGMLWGLAWMIRTGHDAALLQRRLISLLDRGERRLSGQGDETPDELAAAIKRLAGQIAEVDANVMLTPAQQEIKRSTRQARIAEDLVAKAVEGIEQNDFDAVEKLLRQLVNEVPDNPDHESLQQRLAEARTAARAARVRNEMGRVEDLMAMAAFDQAGQVAQALAAEYPDSEEIRALGDRVQREAETFAVEHRRRLYREVERFAERRQWRQALAAGTKLLEAHPTSPEAESVVAELPTLRENARIEEVRELRDTIGDLLERRRYAEAVAIAEDIVTRFPDTQAARQLGRQLARLKGLARSSDGANG